MQCSQRDVKDRKFEEIMIVLFLSLDVEDDEGQKVEGLLCLFRKFMKVSIKIGRL